MRKLIAFALAFLLLGNLAIQSFGFNTKNIEKQEKDLERSSLSITGYYFEEFIDVLSYDYNSDLISRRTSILLNRIYNIRIIDYFYMSYSNSLDYEEVYNKLKEKYVEIQDFEKCNDSSSAMLLDYINTIPNTEHEIESLEEIIHDLKIIVVELLLSQDIYLEKLSYEEKLLLKATKEEKIALLKNADSKSAISCISSYLNKSFPNNTILSGVGDSNDSTKSIEDVNVTLYTRDNHSVSATIRSDSFTQFEIYYYNLIFDAIGGTRLGDPTYRFNCHSYAWYNSSYDNNNYWINVPYPFLEDVHTQLKTTCAVGYIVVYYYDDVPVHSGIIVSITNGEPEIVSKWGAMGLYRHSISQVPNLYVDPDGLDCKYYYYRPHNYNCSPYSQIKHKCTCSICNYIMYENHLWNISHTVCLVCGYHPDDPGIVESFNNKYTLVYNYVR